MMKTHRCSAPRICRDAFSFCLRRRARLAPVELFTGGPPVNTHHPASDSDTDSQRLSQAAQEAPPQDPHEPDFSRLRQARATLDNAFPED
jgi:hypothetical protein